MPQKDDGAGELYHPEEVLWVVFPANDDATKVMKPREQAFDLPAATVATQCAAVLCGFFASRAFVRSDQLHTEPLANVCVQRVAVVSAVADQALGSFREEAVFEGGSDEFCFMRRS